MKNPLIKRALINMMLSAQEVKKPLKFKNIEQALIIDRPNDKIIKVLNNKYAIVSAVFDNGKFEKPQICFLNNGTIFFYPALISEFNEYVKYILTGRRTDKKYFKNMAAAYLLINNI